MGWTHLRYIPLCITTKLTGGNGAQRNCRPVERWVMHLSRSSLRCIVLSCFVSAMDSFVFVLN